MGFKYVHCIYMCVCGGGLSVLMAGHISKAVEDFDHYWESNRESLCGTNPRTRSAQLREFDWLKKNQGSHVYSPMCYQFPQHPLINPKLASLNSGNHGDRAEQRERRGKRGGPEEVRIASLSWHRKNEKICMCAQFCAQLSLF